MSAVIRHPAAGLADAGSGIVIAVFAVLLFFVVIVVTAVLMAILQSVLPPTDTGADMVEAAELQRASEGTPDEPDASPGGPGAP